MSPASPTHIGLVIPVLNAERHLDDLLPALQSQTLKPHRFLVMDSQSDDGSAERFRGAGAEIVMVKRDEFDHGGTRQRAAEMLPDCDILIYLTQDALPASSESFARLVAAFEDPKVGMAYGRQLPHKDATPISTHARLYNYPADSKTVSYSERQRHGFRACFASNSYAAYRRSALESIGGFPSDTLFGEESLVAARLLEKGWLKQYAAGAEVFHSHNYSMFLDFRRAFDIGAFHSKEPWLLESFGSAGGEGFKFVASEIRYLARRAPVSIISALTRSGFKFLGYHMGRRYRMFPTSLNRYFSLNRHYWSHTALVPDRTEHT